MNEEHAEFIKKVTGKKIRARGWSDNYNEKHDFFIPNGKYEPNGVFYGMEYEVTGRTATGFCYSVIEACYYIGDGLKSSWEFFDEKEQIKQEALDNTPKCICDIKDLSTEGCKCGGR